MDSSSPQETAAAVQRGDTVIDVRTADEFSSGHVPGSVFMPLPTVPLRLAELDRQAPVYITCESGGRAFQACLYLEQNGYRAIHVSGGMVAWRAAGLPMELGLHNSPGAQ